MENKLLLYGKKYVDTQPPNYYTSTRSWFQGFHVFQTSGNISLYKTLGCANWDSPLFSCSRDMELIIDVGWKRMWWKLQQVRGRQLSRRPFICGSGWICVHTANRMWPHGSQHHIRMWCWERDWPLVIGSLGTDVNTRSDQGPKGYRFRFRAVFRSVLLCGPWTCAWEVYNVGRCPHTCVNLSSCLCSVCVLPWTGQKPHLSASS